MINKNLHKLLKKSKGEKTMYGLSKALDISPQAGAYIVKEKPLEQDYIRLQKIAEYMGCEIEDIIDL